MLSASDASVTGHLGYSFVASEGKHNDVARRLADMLQYTRICQGCLLSEWDDGMTASEASEALRRARRKCDAFCSSCAHTSDECDLHAGMHWTKRRCTCCKAAGIDCVTLLALGASMDAGGNQGGLIKRAFDGTLEAEEPAYYDGGGARLYGLPLLCDGVHFNKSLDSCIRLHKLWLDGWLCGVFQLWSRYLDADAQRRAEVRRHLTRELLRGKNAFSIEQSTARRSAPLIAALLSDVERAAGRAWLVSTLGPCVDRVWRENTESMYGRPMGVVFHTRSNLLFYVDHDMRQLRVLKLSHTPCDNSPVTSTSSRAAVRMHQPVGIALLEECLFITDASTDHPGILVIDVKYIAQRFNAAAEAVEATAVDAPTRAGASAAQASLRRLELSEPLCEPYGITATAGNELYVTDRNTYRVMRLSLGSGPASKSAAVEEVARLHERPAGIVAEPALHRLLVAAESSIYCVSLAGAADEPQVVLCVRQSGADFCGLSLAPPALGCDLFAISCGTNAVLRLRRSPQGSEVPFVLAETLAGGNDHRPGSQGSSVWYEGTASKTELWRPTFCCFARNAFVFMNAGHGKFGKVLVLNDLHPFATELLPAMLRASDAFCLTADASQHAVHRMHAAIMLEELRDLMVRIEDDNAAAPYCTPKGCQGERGNFSNVVRRSSRQLPEQLMAQSNLLTSLGAPRSCMLHLSPKATLTLPCENSFGPQRARWANPQALQYAQQHAACEDMEARRAAESSKFSMYTGSRTNRTHYAHSGIKKAAQRFRLAKPRMRRGAHSGEHHSRLHLLFRAAALFKVAAQGRVTDKAKETVGSMPAISYSRRAMPVSVSAGAASADASLDAFFLGSRTAAGNVGIKGGSSASQASVERVAYRAFTIVLIAGVGRRLEVAQLTEALTEFTSASGELRVSKQYLACRYFVETRDIFAWTLAAAYWRTHGLSDAPVAEERAAESDGTHFSFYSVSTVPHSTILGAVQGFEMCHNSGQLVSFALSEEVLEVARERLSGGDDLPIDDEGDATETARRAEEEAAVAVRTSRSASGEWQQAREHFLKEEEAKKEAKRARKKAA
jgi:hypothetical protein